MNNRWRKFIQVLCALAMGCVISGAGYRGVHGLPVNWHLLPFLLFTLAGIIVALDLEKYFNVPKKWTAYVIVLIAIVFAIFDNFAEGFPPFYKISDWFIDAFIIGGFRKFLLCRNKKNNGNGNSKGNGNNIKKGRNTPPNKKNQRKMPRVDFKKGQKLNEEFEPEPESTSDKEVEIELEKEKEKEKTPR